MIFKLLEWWQKCMNLDGKFVQRWIQCTDLTHMWHFPIHTLIDCEINLLMTFDTAHAEGHK
jgi:hypothetical protein